MRATKAYFLPICTRAAAHHACLALWRYVQVACRVTTVNVPLIPILAPLIHVARHLKDAIRGSAFRIGVHRRSRVIFAKLISVPPQNLVVPLVSPRKNPPVCAARRLLPFSLSSR